MPNYEVTRDITTEECPWLDKPITKGTIVYKCWGYDYGSVDHRVGAFVTFNEEGKYPGFELPLTAIRRI